MSDWMLDDDYQVGDVVHVRNFGRKDYIWTVTAVTSYTLPLTPSAGPPGNSEATPECSAHSGSCNTYRQHRDLAGEWMVAAVELGDDPFSYYYTNGVP